MNKHFFNIENIIKILNFLNKTSIKKYEFEKNLFLDLNMKKSKLFIKLFIKIS